jgi:hypothetical protein
MVILMLGLALRVPGSDETSLPVRRWACSWPVAQIPRRRLYRTTLNSTERALLEIENWSSRYAL